MALYQAEAFVKLGTTTTQALRDAVDAFHASVAATLDDHQERVNAYFAELQSVVGWWFPFPIDAY